MGFRVLPLSSSIAFQQRYFFGFQWVLGFFHQVLSGEQQAYMNKKNKIDNTK